MANVGDMWQWVENYWQNMGRTDEERMKSERGPAMQYYGTHPQFGVRGWVPKSGEQTYMGPAEVETQRQIFNEEIKREKEYQEIFRKNPESPHIPDIDGDPQAREFIVMEGAERLLKKKMDQHTADAEAALEAPYA